MATLVFSVAEVKAQIAHVRSCKKQSAGFGQKAFPALFLVHDDGVYLMSSGLPRMLADGKSEKDKDARSVVAYARGFDPSQEDPGALHQAASDAVGGDDFAEPLPVEMFEKALASLPSATEPVTEIEVRVSQRSISVAPRVSRKRPDWIKVGARVEATGKMPLVGEVVRLLRGSANVRESGTNKVWRVPVGYLRPAPVSVGDVGGAS